MRQLSKDSAIYGLGSILSRGISFLLLLVFSRILKPTDFGQIELLLVTSTFFSAIIILDLDSAQNFYFIEEKSNGIKTQSQVVTSIFAWRILWGGAWLAIASLLSTKLSHFLSNGNINRLLFVIVFFHSFFLQLVSQSLEIFRLQFKPRKYVSITFFLAISTAMFTFLGVAVLKKGVFGFLLGNLISSILTAFVGMWKIREFLDFSLNPLAWWKKFLKFSLPMVPGGFALYFLINSDRWFINYFHGTQELGLYALGSKFAMLLSLGVQAFRMAWWPMAMEALNLGNRDFFFRKVSKAYLSVTISCIALLTALAPALVKIIAAREFFPAFPIVGILAWYPVFYGFHLISSCGIWRTKSTIWFSILPIMAAAVNLILNFFLVPIYGGVGAAVGTSISFLLWNMLSMFISEKLWRIGFPYLNLIFQVAIGFLGSLWIFKTYSNEINLFSGLSIAMLTSFLLLLLNFAERVNLIQSSKKNEI